MASHFEAEVVNLYILLWADTESIGAINQLKSEVTREGAMGIWLPSSLPWIGV